MRNNTTLKIAAAFGSLALGTGSFAQDQNWMVGQNVDMLIYTQPFWGGCSPTADYTITMPMSPVSGVDYKIVVTSLDPPTGSVTILPGLDNGTVGSELVIDAEVERSVLFAPGTSSGTLEFRAVGVPTTAGQPHPCQASAFWMSNLMFCPEGLIPVINNGCSVQLSTGVTAAAATVPPMEWPSAANGQQLTVGVAGGALVQIMDLNGRVVLARAMGPQARSDLSQLGEGMYLLHLTATSGQVEVRRFVISAS